ncbi:MAG: ParB N-terminal domain-containing protein [Pseudoalteromonas sp.]|uniref:ParB/RepB/Spo0J family partition protein n=1 Tax=Pseudoalteromonas sp. TaxID=53249 RepID=UPI0025E69F11|nr:ParB N-terminal domain-containing protein [Pseudoalteromonas sp.]MCH2089494.1 ParB N-terminal domain-containing protein [Pseudoalteromonas sp.]
MNKASQSRKARLEQMAQQAEASSNSNQDHDEKKHGVVKSIDLKDIIRTENIRFDLPLENIENIQKSMEANGQLQPIGVQIDNNNPGKYRLVFGFCRYEAALRSVKIDRLDAKVFDSDINVPQIQVIENSDRKDNSKWEEWFGKFRAIEFEQTRFKGIRVEQIEQRLGYKPPFQSKLKKIGKVIIEGSLSAFYEINIALNTVLDLCMLLENDDEELLAFIDKINKNEIKINSSIVNNFVKKRKKELEGDVGKEKNKKKQKIIKPENIDFLKDNEGKKFFSLSTDNEDYMIPLEEGIIESLKEIVRDYEESEKEVDHAN